jgi:hypothetical protein
MNFKRLFRRHRCDLTKGERHDWDEKKLKCRICGAVAPAWTKVIADILRALPIVSPPENLSPYDASRKFGHAFDAAVGYVNRSYTGKEKDFRLNTKLSKSGAIYSSAVENNRLYLKWSAMTCGETIEIVRYSETNYVVNYDRDERE